jgi:UDP-2,3-diacylglucosamine pyrophosphatase LpxH
MNRPLRHAPPEAGQGERGGQPKMNLIAEPRQYRTLFISDLHLGTKGCQVGQLLHFLVNHEADTIYLVGDIIDGWQLDSRWYWPDEHNAVLRLLKAKAENGSRVVYLPGNHDEFVRAYIGSKADSLEIHESIVHEAADGKRYLVVHGDCFDPVQQQARWLAFVGDHAYVFALAVNTFVNGIGRRFGLPYWSFSNWAKMKIKGAVNFIGHYEQELVAAARENNVDGVVCGHIHRPAMHDEFGLRYVNCGDWVESCTAVVEHDDGRLEIINWANLREARTSQPGVEDEGESEQAIA